MKQRDALWKNQGGYAVVEATILFPIIIMIFFGLVILSMYLPSRMILQEATQYAATAIATEQSDTWLEFDEDAMKYEWVSTRESLPNVYVAILASFFKGDAQDQAETIVETIDGKSVIRYQGDLEVRCDVNNYVIYKEIVVTASRTIPVPVNLSFVNFPTEIPVTVTSTAVVQNGDEFVRNIDLAAQFVKYLAEEHNLSFDGLSKCLGKAWKFLGV